MGTVRITQRLMVERSLGALQTGLGRLARTQEQLSSGRVLNRPSDSPTGTNEAMRLRSGLAAGNQHARNIADGLTFLGRTDDTLTTMVDQVRRARDLVLQGMSTGSAGPATHQALAAELTGLRADLLGLANTQHQGRPLFGGTVGPGPAYAADGTFVGDPHEVRRAVADGVEVAVNVTGPQALATADGTGLFEVLDETIALMTTDPDALGGTLGALDALAARMLEALADVGARYARVERAQETAADVVLQQTTALSEVENVDLARAVMDLRLQEVAYQSALGATARVLQPSLLDFLR